MEKIILSIFLFSMMTMPLHAQWKNSQFFQDAKKSEYTISLHTVKEYSLSKEDTKTLIDILSAYNWEEFRIIEQQGIETWPIIEDNEYFNSPFNCYNIVITHPYKLKVTLPINYWGNIEGHFLIEYSNDRPYKDLIRCNSSFHSWDKEKIKQLFFKNNVVFNNIAENQTVKIHPQFSFYNVFSKLTLPAAPVDTALSKQFIRLYNSGWNKGVDNSRNGRIFYSSGDGRISHALWHFYTHHNIILTGSNSVLPYFSNHNFDFKDANTPQELTELVNKMLNGHDGEGEQTIEQQKIKIYYQYKDGLLHGEVKKYSLDGKLTDEVTFDKGLPTDYIKYADNGIKEKEIHFVPGDVSRIWANIAWTEYDEIGDVKDSGKSQIYYRNIAYNNYDDFLNFYKINK